MDSNRCGELRLGRAALQRNGEALDYLARVSTHHVTADDTISLAIDDQLHEDTLVAAAERVFQRTEVRFVDIDFAKTLARLRLGQTYCSDRRLAEDCRRHVVVIDAHRALAEERLRHRTPFGDRDRRQVLAIRHVPDRVDILGRCTRIAIDHDRAHPVEHYARILESDSMRIRGTPGREHNETCIDRGAAGGGDGHASAVAPVDSADEGFETQVDSALAHLCRQCEAQIVVESAQEDLAAMDHRDSRAQSMEDSRKLEADITTANNDYPLRHPSEVECFVRRYCEFGAGNSRDRRPSAGCHKTIFGGDAFAADRDSMRVNDPRAASEYLDARVD